METNGTQVRAYVPALFAAAAYALLVFFTVFTLGPLIWVVVTSLKNQQEIMAGLLSLPEQWSFANYQQAWELGNFTPLFTDVNPLVAASALPVSSNPSAAFGT